MTVRLVVKTGFHAFGKDFRSGDVLDPVTDTKGWPSDGLANRLRNDWLEYREVADDAAPVEGETDRDAIQRASDAGQLPAEAGSVPAKDDVPQFGRMSAEDLAAFVQAQALPVDLGSFDGIKAKRDAVREAYAAKLETAPVGGTAGATAPAA